MTDDSPRIETASGGTTVIYQRKNLYHPEAPKEHAQSAARLAELPENCLILLPSPLLGYGLETLLSRIPETSRLLCVEADEKLMKISLEQISPALLADKRIHLVRAGDVRSLLSYVNSQFELSAFRRTITIALNRGHLLYREFYSSAGSAILEAIQGFWRNRMTEVHLGRLWMKNLFLNLPLLTDAHPITGLSFQKPVAVAGAGESLETAIPLLRAHREEISIISVDTALPVLVQEGILPDLVIAAESQFANLYDFYGFRNWDIPVAGDLTSYPGILRRFTGPRYFYLSRFSDLAWLNRPEVSQFLPPMIPPLGSVGVIALYLADLLSGRGLPIFLAGLDFFYIAEKPHARGAPSHTLSLSTKTRLQPSRAYSAWSARPKVRASLLSGRKVSADAVLESYSRYAAEIVSRRKGIYALGDRGLDFGAGRILSEAELRLCLAQKAGTGGKSRDGQKLSWEKSSLSGFMDLCLRELRTYIKAAETGALYKDLEKRISEIDYITLDFPDVPPIPSPSSAFIGRTTLSAAGYAVALSHAVEALNRQI